MKLNLVYLSGNTTGGWVTYCAHLCYGLQMLPDTQIKIVKVGNRTESKDRSFGYGLSYRNMNLEDVVKECRVSTRRTLIVALQKNWKDQAAALMKAGAWMVVHDPAEFKNLGMDESDRYVVIRKAVQSALPGSRLVPHPYSRTFAPGTLATGEWNACSIARIDFDKRTDVLLDANRLLPPEQRIRIHGFENRLYTKFKICPRYEEWEQSACSYPREREAAVRICNRATWSCDMSEIKGDGGGTQYTFLEAMDAGSVNVISRNWIKPDDEMVPWPYAEANCVAVADGAEMAKVLSCPTMRQHARGMALRANVLLSRHHPRRIAKQMVELLWGEHYE